MIVTGLPRDLKHIIYNNIRHFSDTVNFSNKILRSNNVSIRGVHIAIEFRAGFILPVVK